MGKRAERENGGVMVLGGREIETKIAGGVWIAGGVDSGGMGSGRERGRERFKV